MYHAQDYVIRFLRGLTEQYAGPHSQIMLLDPLPDINRVFSMIVQQERQMTKHLVEDSRILANVHTGARNRLCQASIILVKARCALIVAKEATLLKFVTRNMAIRQASKPDKGAETPISTKSALRILKIL